MEPLQKSGIEPRNFQHSVWPSPNWDISADMTEWKWMNLRIFPFWKPRHNGHSIFWILHNRLFSLPKKSPLLKPWIEPGPFTSSLWLFQLSDFWTHMKNKMNEQKDFISENTIEINIHFSPFFSIDFSLFQIKDNCWNEELFQGTSDRHCDTPSTEKFQQMSKQKTWMNAKTFHF